MPSWAEYWAFARVRLGLKKREFYGLTLRQFFEFRKEWMAERRELQEVIAVLRTDIINFSMSHPEKMVTVEDLIGPAGPGKPNAPAVAARMTSGRRKAVAQKCRMVFNALMRAGDAELD